MFIFDRRHATSHLPHQSKRSVFNPAKVMLYSEYSNRKDEDLNDYNPGVQG